MGGRRRAAAAVAMAGVALASAAASASAASCAKTAGTWTCTFAPTGTEEQFTVPAGVSVVTVLAKGAGGSGTGQYVTEHGGGKGAKVTADLPVAPAQVLYVNVGGEPKRTNACHAGTEPGGTECIGGYNGGGSSFFGSGGGGASDVRTVSASQADTLQSRLVVAAGGGGGGTNGSCLGEVPAPLGPLDSGGAGGGAGRAGGPGDPCTPVAPGGAGGGAGTATSGGAGGAPFGGCAAEPCREHGSLGQGGDGGGNRPADNDQRTGGGGGGGWNGGGGGGGRTRVIPSGFLSDVSAAGGGGGGSSFGPEDAEFELAPEVGPGSVTISYVEPCDAALEAHGCWGFDELGGLAAVDSSPFANAGTYVGGPLLGVPGVADTAVSLDGVDDHVRVADSPSLDVGDSFTLEGWIKRDSVRYTHQLFNKGGGGFHLLVMDRFNGNQVWLRKAGSSTIVRSKGGVPADGRYHHVVATKNGPNSARLFIDGVEQELHLASTVQVIQDTTSPLFFSATKAGNPVAGDLDEFAVYDRVLTPAEVEARFQGGDSAVSSASARAVGSEGAVSPSRSDPASGDGLGPAVSALCADIGGPESGVTAIRAAGLSCAGAQQLIEGDAGLRQAAGLDCRIAGEDFSGPVVRIEHECTGLEGRRLSYTTLS